VKKINENIIIMDEKTKFHSKASEEYIHVNFIYDNLIWDGWIPIEYRRTGVSLKTEEEIKDYLLSVYDKMNHINFDDWFEQQSVFWKTKNKARITKSFFDILATGDWKCVDCTLPKNPNFARRIQDLKEFGYTISTDTNRFCKNCNSNKTHLILLPIPRGSINSYETWTKKLRDRIIKVLNYTEVYENKYKPHCLPDHKFPEIRWDAETKAVNSENMTNDEIKNKFQLLTNQHNEQKREVCRKCFQTNKRGFPFGIKYFYIGNEDWSPEIPLKGKKAEDGCRGCFWYDMAKWRESLNKKVNE